MGIIESIRVYSYLVYASTATPNHYSAHLYTDPTPYRLVGNISSNFHVAELTLDTSVSINI